MIAENDDLHLKSKERNNKSIFLCSLQEKEAFIISQFKAKGLTVRDEQGERMLLCIH